ncbi:hypothetical protein AB0L40_12995 [Patulibacter sp. NPDC049589]|uniref:hypothetical protein n=1 Tax=Patulibacter sp. NPDC049589 TaxID=3154731 RepID=UPI003421B9B4
MSASTAWPRTERTPDIDRPSARTRTARGLRWLPFVVVAVEIAVVGAGAVPLGSGLVVVVAVELLLGVVVLAEIAVVVRTFRAARANGRGRAAALEDAMRGVLPPLPARLVIMEARTFSSLARWPLRRRIAPEAAVTASYGRQLRPLLLALLPVSILELVVVELVVPWTAVRIVLLVASAYFCLWLLGLVASMWVRPHWVADGRLALNCMTFASLHVPLERVVGVRAVRVSGMPRSVEVDGDVLTVSVMGAANVELELEVPVAITGDRPCDARRVRFYADRPQDVIRAIEAAG